MKLDEFLVCFCLFYPYFDAFSSDFSNICQHSYPYNHLYINILKTRMTVTDVFQLYTCARTRARDYRRFTPLTASASRGLSGQ